uniref:protein-disulfide reductase n=1 Tax=Ananas comosus var. bracteatus TaxID=296719 RepID=A0A6V7PN99_ANACO|nr:unnamed protein product [Ananas comosus var. bracteatus]
MESTINGDLSSLLAGAERDYLVRSNGNKVKISNLDASTVGLYFSSKGCGPCRRFTPKLVEAYNELSSRGDSFEIVFVPCDRAEDAFDEYFSKMPWLAVPFSDSSSRERLGDLFKVVNIPNLTIIDRSGNVIFEKGVQFVGEYGADVYPFTPEKVLKLEEEKEAAKREQTLRSLLVSPTRDYVVSNNGDKVPVSELEGKVVGLYFTVSHRSSDDDFTPVLNQLYEKLKEIGENFEVVLISLEEEESTYNESFAKMPWLAVPFKDKICDRLFHYFELQAIPTLVIVGADGKTLNNNVAEIVEGTGQRRCSGFHFPEKMEIVAEKAREKAEKQTLESILVHGELDHVVRNGDTKVPVAELIGKNILLYFSAQWCRRCRAFLPKLVEEYHKIKEKDDAFEVIFISYDEDQNSYNDFFSSMPWLALPFEDERVDSLSRIFKIRSIPSLVAIGATGRTITDNAKELLTIYGADAYPFTAERIKELEEEKKNDQEQKAKEGFVCDGGVCRRA